MITTPAFVSRLRDDKSGLALLEFAFALPILMLMALTGAEMTNYITTKMRASQLALQLADNAARMGNSTSSQLQVQISEADINDLFTGAQLQSGEMDLTTNGRVILSSLEPVASPNTTSKYKIRWQRCFGLKPHPSTYGTAGDTDMTGMGPATRQVTAQDDNATMFVELYYVYKPLIGLGALAPSIYFTEIASMAVRDRRDFSDDSATTNLHPNGIYKVTGVTASTCA